MTPMMPPAGAGPPMMDPTMAPAPPPPGPPMGADPAQFMPADPMAAMNAMAEALGLMMDSMAQVAQSMQAQQEALNIAQMAIQQGLSGTPLSAPPETLDGPAGVGPDPSMAPEMIEGEAEGMPPEMM